MVIGSAYIEEAYELLECVRGKPQTIEERKRLSLELAALLLRESARAMTLFERREQEQLARLMQDPIGKPFAMAITDECFRSTNQKRIADQLIFLLHQLGTPLYLDWFKQSGFIAFRALGSSVAKHLVPMVIQRIRKEASRLIVPGETALLKSHLEQRKLEGARLNLNHLGEVVLSESAARERLQACLEDLKHPLIDAISVKVSTLFSQINLVDFEGTLNVVADRLRTLYRAAQELPMRDAEGVMHYRSVNLDMEEYRDLHLTVDVFRRVLDEPAFQGYSAGIALQAYLPDSYALQRELTEWAQARVKNGGAPIKLRIVKGAHLAVEQIEASLRGWPQAPYTSKVDVDANFKKMLIYGCVPEHARAVRLGIASHNLFDIAFAMLLRQEQGVEAYTEFEMLEGMAGHMRRVVHSFANEMLLYCPIATQREFQYATAYLIRRLEENTGSENFLRTLLGLKPGTDAWDHQTALFGQSCEEISSVSAQPRRTQNRSLPPPQPDPPLPFENEPDTDFSLPHNRAWVAELLQTARNQKPSAIPLVIDGEELYANEEGVGINPSDPATPFYTYAQAHSAEIEVALCSAKQREREWAATSMEDRARLLIDIAQRLRERRKELIGVMMMDGAKAIAEADTEVSEAIDFAEYYRHQYARLSRVAEIRWEPRGTLLVVSPWNFPCSIPAEGILAALMTGNCVLFKPSSETVLTAWHLANAIWDAGVPRDVLQFVPCIGEGPGAQLVCDSRIDGVILTGGTATARALLRMRPGIHLAAAASGKNALIVTALSDRELAVKDLIQSALSHSGQKCSAASLAILEAEVYDDPHFRRNLREAAASLPVGPAWDAASKITPLIYPPRDSLRRTLTTLEEGEEWVLEPREDPHNPHLWSPGIKWGVRPGSFTHQTEFFGPLLSVMRANDLSHAIELANATPYGLTAGLHSLDEREQTSWLDAIEAGNCTINRPITGAIVRRQPFGGTKASSFGHGYKSGGPNYLRGFVKPTEIKLPQEKYPVNERVNSLTSILETIDLSAEQLGVWYASVANYAYWWKRMRLDRDPTKLLGQDNYFRYVPLKQLLLRVTDRSSPLDALRVCAAALTVGAPLEISWEPHPHPTLNWLQIAPLLRVATESEEQFLQRLPLRVRLVEPPSRALIERAAETSTHLITDPVLAVGRFELLHYLREVSISIDYHRYGHLGVREGELRKPVV